MFIQTKEKYKTITMGFGEGSIYDYGCYLVSLCNGLNRSGYNFTPESLNQFLKDKKLFIRSGSHNYIGVDRLKIVLPNIFKDFQKVESWTSKSQLLKFLNNNYVVLGKVNAKGIGGTGTHFVLITGYEGANVIIHDPYTGEHQKVAIRYNDYKNILELRVFQVVRKLKGEIMPQVKPENELLKHMKVKTTKEAKEVWDKEMKFLKDAREKIDELVETHKNSTAQYIANAKKDKEIRDEIEKLTGIEVKKAINIPGALASYCRKQVNEDKKIENLENAMKAKPKATVELAKEPLRLAVSFGVGFGLTWLYNKYPFLGELVGEKQVIAMSIIGVVIKSLDKAKYTYGKLIRNKLVEKGLLGF